MLALINVPIKLSSLYGSLFGHFVGLDYDHSSVRGVHLRICERLRRIGSLVRGTALLCGKTLGGHPLRIDNRGAPVSSGSLQSGMQRLRTRTGLLQVGVTGDTDPF